MFPLTFIWGQWSWMPTIIGFDTIVRIPPFFNGTIVGSWRYLRQAHMEQLWSVLWSFSEFASSNNDGNIQWTGLSFYTSEKTLRAAFEGFGELVEGMDPSISFQWTLIDHMTLVIFDVLLPQIVLIVFFLTVKIIMDKISKRSKGYAFIEYTTEEAAGAALKEMNGKVLKITVCVAFYLTLSLGKKIWLFVVVADH